MSPNPVDTDDWRTAGIFAKAFLHDIYCEAKRKEILQASIQHALIILEKKPTTDDSLWDSSIEEALQKVAHNIENTYEALDNYETDMIKQILLKGHQVVNTNR